MNESQLGLFYGLSFLCVALAFAFAAYLYLWVKKQKTENAKIQEVSLLIKQGANTFMRREYLVLAACRLEKCRPFRRGRALACRANSE